TYVLRESGIQVNGTYFSQTKALPPEARSAITNRSPATPQLIKTVNKRSNNFFAEQLLTTIGMQVAKKGSRRTAVNRVMSWLNSIGILNREFIMIDGSGLSRKNLIAPISTARLLRTMYNHADFQLYYESLPIAGVDGTLRYRMKGTAAEGNVRAKTGYVSNVRCLSGYVKDKKQRPYIFVIMVNHYSVPTSYVNQFQDNICNILCNYNGPIP
ncbi:MAG: D-alanyl-D-alanine carboxypeptidase/D-alanyl-D-alanine-endopeptidase, partial [Caldithrix sp.]|nr:D-alanyl-D-alanine carboxypeptidase/D-alanyl-D-alanine-endopeptidase [Caldithrix sp.]